MSNGTNVPNSCLLRGQLLARMKRKKHHYRTLCAIERSLAMCERMFDSHGPDGAAGGGATTVA